MRPAAELIATAMEGLWLTFKVPWGVEPVDYFDRLETPRTIFVTLSNGQTMKIEELEHDLFGCSILEENPNAKAN